MRLALFALALPLVALAQEPATVTVYTPGGNFRGTGRDAVTLSIGKNTAAPSEGWFFDNDVELTKLMPHQYATFQLPAGVHSFSAANAKKPKTTEPSKVTLEPGKHYFLQMTTSKSGAYIVQSFHSHVAVVPCEQAREEADTNHPVKIRLVEKDARSKLVDSTYFPRCDQAN